MHFKYNFNKFNGFQYHGNLHSFFVIITLNSIIIIIYLLGLLLFKLIKELNLLTLEYL